MIIRLRKNWVYWKVSNDSEMYGKFFLLLWFINFNEPQPMNVVSSLVNVPNDIILFV